MEEHKTYLEQYLSLTSEIYIEETSNNDEYTVFSFKHYLIGFLAIKNSLKNELENNLLSTAEGKEEVNIERVNQKLESNIKQIEVVNADKIKDWFIKYDEAFDDFESILNLDQNSNLYFDLNLDEYDQRFIHVQEIYEMQLDFLNFTKRETIGLIKYWIRNFYDNSIRKYRTNKGRKVIRSHKTFQEYFNNKYLERLVILKKIFNENQSPKVYAMMLSILTQKRIVTIESRGRTNFYKSWYDYIEKNYPERANFSAINDYIDSKEDGFSYKYETDPDYKIIIACFKEEFM